MKECINVWEKRRINGNQMPKDQLRAEIDAFISNKSNCAFATGYGTYIRNTPMRYSYKGGKFILITEGGYKFKGLSANSHVCLAIYDTHDLDSNTMGVTVEGIAKVTEIVKENATSKDPRSFMITVVPYLFDYLNYKLPERGYYQLQRLEID